MKNPITTFVKILLPLATMMICAGCPVGIDYPLGSPGKEKIDEKLVGTWVALTEDAEMKKLVVTKKDANTLNVKVLERGEMYAFETDDFEAWVTRFGNKTFVYGRPIGDATDQKFYHYMYSFDNGKLVTQDMSLLEGGMDAVTSQEALHKEVMASMSKPEFETAKIEYIKE